MLASGVMATTNRWAITLTTTNAVIAPSRTYSSSTITNTWAASTNYTAGAYVANSNSVFYWTPNGGTATNQPTHKSGLATGADSIQWLSLKSRSRNNITVQLVDSSSGDAWIESGADAAVVDACYLLSVRGMAWDSPGYSGELNGIAGSGTRTIVITEE